MNTTLSKITVADYMRFMQAAERWQDSDDPLADYKLLEEYSGQDFSDVDEPTMKAALNEIIEEMLDTATIEEKLQDMPLPQSIKVGGVKYQVPQNLAHQAKMAQYVDYAGFTERYDGPPHGICAIVCAIFLKKPKELYSQIRLQDRIETMKQMRLVDAIKITSFFLIQSVKFNEITTAYWNRRQPQVSEMPHLTT